MDDLEVLEPAVRSVPYRGERLEVRPLTVGMIPRIVRIARPVIDGLLNLDALPDDQPGEMVALVMDMIEQHGERLYEAVAIAVARERVWIEGGDLSEFLGLALLVFEVNRDFFDQKLGPLLADARARAKSGRGPTPSSSSLSVATA